MAEIQFRRRLRIAQGDAWVFLQKPISAALLAVALAAIVGPVLLRWSARRAPRG